MILQAKEQDAGPAEIKGMTTSQLRAELRAALDKADGDTLRALLGALHGIDFVRDRAVSVGRIEGDIQGGRVKRWRWPVVEELYA